MTNINSKEVLAKLLATENIDIVHANVSTASFDVKERVLTLPMWEDMKDFTYDHLVGHEVGHALWTDADKWAEEISKNPKNFKGFLNIVEDARIEKLIQRKYPGLKSSFIKSYKKMLADGFFGKDADEINSFKLIDRLNILFKCGQTVGVNIEKDERIWVDKMASIETFDQAIALAHELFGKAKQEHQEKQAAKEEYQAMMSEEAEDEFEQEFESDQDGDEEFEPNSDYDDPNGWGDDEDDSDDEEDSTSSSDSDESDNGDDDSQSSSGGNSIEDVSNEETSETKSQTSAHSAGENTPLDPDLPIAETEQSLENNIEQEFGKTDSDVDIKNWSLDLNEKRHTDRIIGYKTILEEASSRMQDALSAGTKMYRDFQINNKKTINYLVKEFEMKKKASEYKRATVSKTGVIDTLKMNNYKFSDDIFKKMTIVPDGKNHGLVMFIDWSGSMASQMANTIDQLINLVSFCRQVQIPFQVYAFSDNDYRDDINKLEDGMLENLKNKNMTAFTTSYHLLQFFDSKMSRTEFQKACALTLAIGKFWQNRYRYDNKYGFYSVSRKFWLSGTPLNDAIISAHVLVKQFQKSKRLDIVNTIFLTDGASHSAHYYSHYHGDVRLGKTYIDKRWSHHGHRHTIINPITKKQFRINYGKYHSSGDITKTLIKSLADYTGSNVIGFHILPTRKPSALNEMPYSYEYSQKLKMWETLKKQKFCIFPDTGYTKQFAVLGSDLQTSNGEIVVKENATTGQIRNAFKKANKGKKESRLMLSQFIDLVA